MKVFPEVKDNTLLFAYSIFENVSKTVYSAGAVLKY